AVPGIGPARARLLEKLAIYTVEDLLCFAPRRHLDARRGVSVQGLVPGLRATVAGRVVEAERRPTRPAGLWLARGVVEDDAGGRLELVAFAREIGRASCRGRMWIEGGMASADKRRSCCIIRRELREEDRDRLAS